MQPTHERSSIQRALTRSRELLENHRLRAAQNGERAISFARLIFTVLVAVRIPWQYTDRFWEGAPIAMWPFWTCVFGALYSAWVLHALRSPKHTNVYRVLGTIIDPLLAAGSVFQSIRPVDEGYHGFLDSSLTTAFLIVLVGSALRQRKELVWLSAVINALIVAGLVMLDLSVNPTPAGVFAQDVVLWVIYFIATVVMCLGLVRRSRGLVYDTAASLFDVEHTRARFGAYVSPEIADIALSSRELRPGGAERAVAVLFSDLRGFTRYSENLPPDQLIEEINQYLDAMVHVLTAEGAVIDKFIGDAIMAVFGIPDATGDESARAVRAAAAMNDALAALNQKRADRGLPPLAHGIGIHMGVVVAGNVGSRTRMQYTVLGDVVNLASRIESATKSEGRSVLISEAAALAAQATDPHLELAPHGTLDVRGRAQSVRVHTLA